MTNVFGTVAETMMKIRTERDDARAELAETRERLAHVERDCDLALQIAELANDVGCKMRAERDAALAKVADSDARLVRALDAAKAAALEALNAPSPGAASGAIKDWAEVFDDGRDSGEGVSNADAVAYATRPWGFNRAGEDLYASGCGRPECFVCGDDGLVCDVARKARLTPDVRR